MDLRTGLQKGIADRFSCLCSCSYRIECGLGIDLLFSIAVSGSTAIDLDMRCLVIRFSNVLLADSYHGEGRAAVKGKGNSDVV